MKVTVTDSHITQPSLSIPQDFFPMACLLGLASFLALFGGMPSAVLFFGLIFVFALLLIAGRFFGTPRLSPARIHRAKR